MKQSSSISKNHCDLNLIERLKASPFFQVCQNAFREGTDLPLIVQSADRPTFNPCHSSPHQNPFCQSLNSSHGSCQQCVLAQRELFSHSTDKASTNTCFAGLKETAVPLKLGNHTVGFLKTGQIFTNPPSPEQIKAAHDALVVAGYSKTEQKKVVELYTNSSVFDQDKYKSMITLLSLISLQLTEFLNKLLLESNASEPDTILKAKELIANRIDEKITLKEVSNEVHVSVFYFCNLFKKTTGMTFTEYVNRQRVELAKDELKNTEKTITEIAYAVGFQSLSQFNRSFLKFAGEPPREYRQHNRSIPTGLHFSH